MTTIIDKIKECIANNNLKLVIEWGEELTIEDVAAASAFDWVTLSKTFGENIVLADTYDYGFDFDAANVMSEIKDNTKDFDLVLLLSVSKFECYKESFTVYIEYGEDSTEPSECDINPELLKQAWDYAVSIGTECERFSEDSNEPSEYNINPELLKQAWDYAVSIGAEYERFGEVIRKFRKMKKSEKYKKYLSGFRSCSTKSARKLPKC